MLPVWGDCGDYHNLVIRNNLLVENQHIQTWWKRFFVFSPQQVEGGQAGFTSHDWTELACLSLHNIMYVAAFLSTYLSGIPKAHFKDDRNKHKIFKLEVDSFTDMKASPDFTRKW